MPVREIPRDEWSRFFSSFSEEHAGWLATLELRKAGFETKIQAQGLPFGGISADADNTVWIGLGARDPDRHLTHRVDHVTHVRLRETDDGAHEALQLEAEDAATTLRFRTTIRADQVDGIAPGPSR